MDFNFGSGKNPFKITKGMDIGLDLAQASKIGLKNKKGVKNDNSFGDFSEDIETNFFKFAGENAEFIKGASGSGDFSKFENMFNDFTSKPKGSQRKGSQRKGSQRKGRPKISNDPNEFGIGLQSLGDAIRISEQDTNRSPNFASKKIKSTRPIRGFKKRVNKKLAKTFPQGEGDTLGGQILTKIKKRRQKAKIKKNLKTIAETDERPQMEEKSREISQSQGKLRTVSRFSNPEDLR